MKLFDIRNLKEELQVFKGHKKEATGGWGKINAMTYKIQKIQIEKKTLKKLL